MVRSRTLPMNPRKCDRSHKRLAAEWGTPGIKNSKSDCHGHLDDKECVCCSTWLAARPLRKILGAWEHELLQANVHKQDAMHAPVHSADCGIADPQPTTRRSTMNYTA